MAILTIAIHTFEKKFNYFPIHLPFKSLDVNPSDVIFQWFQISIEITLDSFRYFFLVLWFYLFDLLLGFGYLDLLWFTNTLKPNWYFRLFFMIKLAHLLQSLPHLLLIYLSNLHAIEYEFSSQLIYHYNLLKCISKSWYPMSA